MPHDAAAAYRDSRERLSDLVMRVGDRADSVKVPACPEWTPKDVVAHVTGICADIMAGKLSGVGTEEWTEAQVSSRRDRTVAQVVEEWAEVGAAVEAMLPAFPPPADGQLIYDLYSHELDVFEALGEPLPAEAKAEAPSLNLVLDEFKTRCEALGTPPLAVVAGNTTREIPGDRASVGESATLRAEPVEILRSLTGRRTADEIRALDWGGADAAPWLDAFEIYLYKLRDVPLAR